MVQPEALGVVHGEAAKLVRGDEAECGGLVGDGEFAAGDAGGEADVEPAAYFSSL